MNKYVDYNCCYDTRYCAWYNNCWLKAVALHNCLLVRALVIFPQQRRGATLAAMALVNSQLLTFSPNTAEKLYTVSRQTNNKIRILYSAVVVWWKLSFLFEWNIL